MLEWIDAKPHRFPTLCAAYFVGFVLTFGCETARFERSDNKGVVETATFGGVMAGLVWPIWMPCRLSIDFFRYHQGPDS